MIKHIVMWRLKDNVEGYTKEENAARVKDMLEALNGKIPGMRRLEVGLDFSRTQDSSDIVLYSEFDSRQALDVYQSHPAHEAVKAFVMAVRSERRVVDYET